MFLISILRNSYRLVRILISYILVRTLYNKYTIARYFRKQGAKIGEDCVFSVRWIGDQPFLVEIGNHVFVARGARLETSESSWIVNDEDAHIGVFGKIIIEDNCMIGMNAQILPNVRIGENSIVGAGSVVINDVPPNSIVMGVPARKVGSSIKYKEKIISEWERIKPPGWVYKNTKQRDEMLKKHFCVPPTS